MLSIQHPSPKQIETFIERSGNLSLSYHPVGIASAESAGFKVDEIRATLGKGEATFALAKLALLEWKQFDLGWVELFPRDAPVETDTNVAVLVHHLGCWSLNGCRVVYSIEDPARFGYAYGTLTNHAECGEEIFEVSLNQNDEVIYRIRAVSRPRAAFTRIGYPITRMFQAKFRRDSAQAMRIAVS